MAQGGVDQAAAVAPAVESLVDLLLTSTVARHAASAENAGLKSSEFGGKGGISPRHLQTEVYEALLG